MRILKYFLIFVFPSLIFGQSSIDYGYLLHQNGASHLAIDTLQKSIKFYKKTANYQKLAEAYKTITEVYHDAGYLHYQLIYRSIL